MKNISEHLGRIIAALAAIALLVACVTGFRTDIGAFFGTIISKEQSIGESILDKLGGFNLGGITRPQLATPTISIDGNTLTITPVENATGYEVYNGNTLLTTSTSTSVDLATYITESGTYTVKVRAIGSSDYKASGYAEAEYVKELVPGLYETGSNYTILLKSWDDMIVDGWITADGKVVSGQEGSLGGGLLLPENLTSIPAKAFQSCTRLTGVKMSNNVIGIGVNAFSNCKKLTSVEISAGVTSIGASMFDGCTSLTSIEIPAGVTSIGNSAFRDCTSLTSITFDENSQLTSIGGYAFSGCRNLASIAIPDSVTKISDYAFRGCTSLTSIEIPAGVTSIGGYAFAGCNSLTSMNVDAGNTVYHSFDNCIIKTADKKLIAGCKNSIIPANGSVTSIAYGAFAYHDSLTSICIPESVSSIENMAFGFCTNLANMTFEGTVAQWNEISKNSIWNYNCGEITVTCTGDENGDGAGTVIVPAYGS